RIARRALEGYSGYEMVEDWKWQEKTNQWYLLCSLDIGLSENPMVPAKTYWYIFAKDYPFGYLEFYPAKTNGLSRTYPHQHYNHPDETNVPWTFGNICLDAVTKKIGRVGGADTEPYTAVDRLKWRVKKALYWLKEASVNNLIAPNESYEIPDIPHSPADKGKIVFSENKNSFETWSNQDKDVGYFEYCRLKQKPELFLIHRFWLTRDNVIQISWGNVIEPITKASSMGIWIKLNSAPILPPWHVPMYWGDMRRVFQIQGKNLDNYLQEKVHRLRGLETILLVIGWPIPKQLNQTSVQMHWFCIKMPCLSKSDNPANGFRPGVLGCWRRDRLECLSDDRMIKWLDTENWSADQISSRGKLSTKICMDNILLIGGGALGSILAELLVRAGVINITILDREDLEIGNLSRHTLTLEDVGKKKATTLATRLNKITPHVKAIGIDESLSPEIYDRIKTANIILDCTGSDEALLQLHQLNWEAQKHFISLSFGYELKRMYMFTAMGVVFPNESFQQQIAPWLEHDRSEYGDADLPREGVGCWSPIFPGRIDNIYTLAGIALKEIEKFVELETVTDTLIVYKQYDDGNGIKISRDSL
ncbi:MAG: ThiF family adenylyltransferase, partial [Bacteroidota bacterium]